MEILQLWVKINQAYPPHCKCKWPKLWYFFCPPCNTTTIILILNTTFKWSGCQWIIKIKLFPNSLHAVIYVTNNRQPQVELFVSDPEVGWHIYYFLVLNPSSHRSRCISDVRAWVTDTRVCSLRRKVPKVYIWTSMAFAAPDSTHAGALFCRGCLTTVLVWPTVT